MALLVRLCLPKGAPEQRQRAWLYLSDTLQDHALELWDAQSSGRERLPQSGHRSSQGRIEREHLCSMGRGSRREEVS